MPFVYVKSGGVWKQVQQMYVNQSGVWKNVATGIITSGGIGKQFYPNSVGPTTFSSAGTYTYTVPATVTVLEITTTGAGGGGSAYYFNGGQGNISGGGAGAATTVTGTGFSITSGGGGGGSVGPAGTNSITGASSTSVNQSGGSPSGTTGGSSYFGLGSGGGGDGSTPATPTAYGAGGGAGYYQNNATQGGYAGATQISRFSVTPGQTVSITVGAGGIGPHINYTQGSNHNSNAGNGADGYVSIKPINPNIVTFSSSSTWTAPAGVTSINLTVAGGGGGQGGNYFDTSQTLRIGSAGTAGQVVTGNVSVTPGQTYTITVGTGGGFGRDSFYTAAGGSNGTGYLNGGTGVSNSAGSGVGGGGASAFLLSCSVIAAAAGGSGGNAATGGGTGGSGGGSAVIPSGGSVSAGTNGGAASSITSVYSGSYGNGQGAAPLNTIRNNLSTTYSYLVSALGTVTGNSPDFSLGLTLAPGTLLWAAGGSGTFVDSAYSTPYSVLNSGGFSMGNTVSGVNFATGATQGNGGSSYHFYYGFTYNNGGNGYVSISY